MSLKKLELNQQTIQNLTVPSDSQTNRPGMAWTFPPVCENTGNCRGNF